MDADRGDLCARIRAQRVKTGSSRRSVAKAIGVPESTIRSWEEGHWPTDRYWAAIARYLGETIQDLSAHVVRWRDEHRAEANDG